MITIRELKERISYDPYTGIMKWMRPISNAVKPGDICGCASKHYIWIKINKRLYSAHRVAWAIFYGEWPQSIVDHVDGYKKNNRISNLRLANKAQNNWNANRRKDNKTGFKGVSLRENGKYRAKIAANGRVYALGVYETAEEASEVYGLAADMLHGEFSNHG